MWAASVLAQWKKRSRISITAASSKICPVLKKHTKTPKNVIYFYYLVLSPKIWISKYGCDLNKKLLEWRQLTWSWQQERSEAKVMKVASEVLHWAVLSYLMSAKLTVIWLFACCCHAHMHAHEHERARTRILNYITPRAKTQMSWLIFLCK